MKRKLVILMVICLLVTALMPCELADSVKGVIKTPAADGSVNIRSEAGVNHSIVGWAKNGAAVEILYQGNKWHKVKVESTGKTGWVYARYVSIGGTANTPSKGDQSAVSGNVASVTTKYAGSTVNIRAGAGTNYNAIAAVTRGTRLSVLSTANGWYQVSVPSKGVTGYISASYVSLGLSARTTGNVNFRTGAGTGYERIGTIAKGSKITVLSVGEKWSQVSYNGKTGYISNAYWSYR